MEITYSLPWKYASRNFNQMEIVPKRVRTRCRRRSIGFSCCDHNKLLVLMSFILPCIAPHDSVMGNCCLLLCYRGRILQGKHNTATSPVHRQQQNLLEEGRACGSAWLDYLFQNAATLHSYLQWWTFYNIFMLFRVLYSFGHRCSTPVSSVLSILTLGCTF
jgi:hypothetical protein